MHVVPQNDAKPCFQPVPVVKPPPQQRHRLNMDLPLLLSIVDSADRFLNLAHTQRNGLQIDGRVRLNKDIPRKNSIAREVDAVGAKKLTQMTENSVRDAHNLQTRGSHVYGYPRDEMSKIRVCGQKFHYHRLHLRLVKYQWQLKL